MKIVDAIRRLFRTSSREKSREEITEESSCRVDIHPQDRDKVRLHIAGSHNTVRIGKLSEQMHSFIDISIYGDCCSVVIDDNFYTTSGVHILLGLDHHNYGKIEHSSLHIGKDTTMESARIITFNSHAAIVVGSDCMFSENVMLYNTDSHPIYDRYSGEIMNYVGNMTIGDHCWLGMNVKILKNVSLAEGCIVGAEALVTGNITEKYCILAGVPARVIKRNVAWKRSDRRWIRGRVC